jgi:hypothetical protein
MIEDEEKGIKYKNVQNAFKILIIQKKYFLN